MDARSMRSRTYTYTYRRTDTDADANTHINTEYTYTYTYRSTDRYRSRRIYRHGVHLFGMCVVAHVVDGTMSMSHM